MNKMICESTKKRALADESEALRIIVICQKDKALREEERDEKDKDLQFGGNHQQEVNYIR